MQTFPLYFRPLVLVLVTVSVYGAPELRGSREVLDQHESSAAVSGERLVLEDPAEWSASTEVLDENHAWFNRRRRSLERKGTEVADLDDLEAAESVVFMPAYLRQKKKMAVQDCRKRLQDRMSWRSANPSTPEQVTWQCNAYCCYPTVSL